MRYPSPHHRIDALARADKWYLGGLDGVLWAPPFSHRLDRPGFWDPVHLLHQEVGPCFSVALLDDEGEETGLSAGTSLQNTGGVPPHDLASPHRTQPTARRWNPGSLVAEWRTHGNHMATETRQVLPGGILESSWTLPPDVDSGCLVAFTAQPVGSVSGVRVTGRGVKWLRTVTDRAGLELAVEMELQGSCAPAWRRVLPSEGGAFPDWPLTPFAEDVGGGVSGGDQIICASPTDNIGWIWIAVAFPVAPADDSELALRLQLTPRLSPPAQPKAGVPPNTPPTPPTWPTFFASFPSFSSGDPHLDRYFDYRVHGLGLNRIEGRWGHIRHPCIAEGPEYFHVPITYSAQCHMMEMRWRSGGREAWGSLLNFLDNQKDDGSLHGRLYPNHLERTDFYHANWGDALLAVHAMHPDPAALARCYEGLTRYARWLDLSRDPEGSGMFTVVNHFETGQEYMSRYMAVDAEADTRGWQPRLRLKGIDVTVYAHQLFRALAIIARRLGHGRDEGEWLTLATRSGNAISDHMWSPEARLFADVDGRTLAPAEGDSRSDSTRALATAPARTNVKAAVGFYPMLTNLVDDARLDAMMDHLEDPRTFGAPFPLPSSSVDDPRFSAEGIWRGKRRNCPWNGRVWPMTTSHVIEGLLRCRRRGNERAGALAADMLVRFVRMMFTDGDPGRPNCFEHYNPYTGRACHFRGIDDYQHSWVLDLLARGIAGLHIDEAGVEVWPLPHELPRVSLGPVRARGHSITVVVDGGRVSVVVDGERHEGSREQPLQVGWDD